MSDAVQKSSTPVEPGTGDIEGTGLDAFIRGVSELAWLTYLGEVDGYRFVPELGDRYAYIRLRDVRRPVRFLRQMAGTPPIQLGNTGFRADILDDYNPARHYVALLFVGYYAPTWLAMLFLYAWEFAGFIRYGGNWSWPDIRSGILGIRHGELVRRYGPTILPALMAAQLAERESDDYGSPSGGTSSGSDAETLRAA